MVLDKGSRVLLFPPQLPFARAKDEFAGRSFVPGLIVASRPHVDNPAIIFYYFKQTVSDGTSQESFRYDGWYPQDYFEEEKDTAAAASSAPSLRAHFSPEDCPLAVSEVCYLSFAVAPWFDSPFHVLGDLKRPSPSTCYAAHICHRCLSAFYEESTHDVHIASFCSAATIPGKIVYENESPKLRVHLIDGAEHVMYCRNLSLLGRCFIDSKDLVNDVDILEFFVVAVHATSIPDDGTAMGKEAVAMLNKFDSQWDNYFVAGYFCRVKHKPDHCLSCITTFPMFQRMGLGMLMLDIAYTACEIRQQECGV